MRLVISQFRFLLVWICLCSGMLNVFVREATAQSHADSERKDPVALLARAKEAMRVGRASQSMIHYHAIAASEQNYQSDRTYPPFFSAMDVEEAWFDPQSDTGQVSTQTTFPGSGASPMNVVITDATGAFGLAEGHLNPLPVMFMQSRNLNPWAVVDDWIAAGGARFAGTETYRDYLRYVLIRHAPSGEQRLFIDPKSGFPSSSTLRKRTIFGGSGISNTYTRTGFWQVA